MSRQLGGLSGLAMILIVLNHSIHMGNSVSHQLGFAMEAGWGLTILTTLQALGVFAVPVFLYVSGSFVAYAARGDPPKLSKKFYLSSFRHILIPYLTWSIIFYILIFFHGNNRYTLLQYLKHLIVGYPFNFIPLLVFFYVLSPILVRGSKHFAGLIIALFAIYQLLLLIALNPGIFGFVPPEWIRFIVPPIIGQTMAEWGIYFPLGLVYGLGEKNLGLWARKFWWLLVSMTVILFTLGMLDGLSILYVPWARHIVALGFVLLIPAIKRDKIPFVRQLERIGRKSYGLYLTHLIVLDLTLLTIQLLVPGLFRLPVLLFPLLFILGVEVPLLLMDITARSPTKRVYRYVFG